MEGHASKNILVAKIDLDRNKTDTKLNGKGKGDKLRTNWGWKGSKNMIKIHCYAQIHDVPARATKETEPCM